MGLRHEDYAKKLVETHGKDHAIKMMKTSLHFARQGHKVDYFDERDWIYNQKHGNYELPKNENKRFDGLKAKRIKDTVNFFYTILNILNRKAKHAKA